MPPASLQNEIGLFRASHAWDAALRRAIARALLPFDKPPKARPVVTAIGPAGVKASFSLGGVKGDITVHNLKASYDETHRMMLRQLVVYREVEDAEFQSLAKKIASFDASPHASGIGLDLPKEGWYLDAFVDDLIGELGTRKDFLTRPLWDSVQSAIPKVEGKVQSHQEALARRRLSKALKSAMDSGLTDKDVMDVWRSVLVQDVMTK